VPLAGYKTFTNHWHLRFTERVRATGSLDTPLPDLAAMKGLGLNKRHRRRTLEDTPAVRGMINKVKHLVRVVDEA